MYDSVVVCGVASLLLAISPPPAPAADPVFPVELTWSGPPSAHEGGVFAYTATVTNNGGASVPVYLQETGGARETSVSAVPSQGTCGVSVPDARLCALGTVASGASATVTFTSTASTVAPLAISLLAFPTPTGGPSVSASYPVAIVAVGDPLHTDVRLSLTGPAEIRAWELGIYTLTARNLGSVAARDGSRDIIACGRGRDLVTADRSDIVARDCETIRLP